MKHRNTNFVISHSKSNYQAAVKNNLMQVTIQNRNGKKITMPNGQEVVEFINCSYLGIDLLPEVIEAGRSIDKSWGVNFCCARSRFSIEPMRILEEELSTLFRARAIVFPSVTTTHISVLPLVASGALYGKQKMRLVFDKYAHASMQFLKPILATECKVDNISHNDIESLRNIVMDSKSKNETVVYIADGMYSMGGLCPIKELLSLAEELEFYLYIDDAHGTSIMGNNGEGSALSCINGALPENMIITFALSKGYGCNGGGVLLPHKIQEELVRTYGQIYAFSAALDFSVINACRAVIPLHYDGTVLSLQKKLRDNVAFYDKLMSQTLPFSPIRMIEIGDEKKAMTLADQLLERGFFVSIAFFPIVPRNKAQLRICIAANHTHKQILEFTEALKNLYKNLG